jgi:hypothetical protein
MKALEGSGFPRREFLNLGSVSLLAALLPAKQAFSEAFSPYRFAPDRFTVMYASFGKISPFGPPPL